MAIIHQIQLEPESQTLSIDHPPCQSEVFYDICNDYGHILSFGHLDVSGTSEADLSQLSAGTYWIQIVFQGELIRKKFQINRSLHAQTA